MDTAAMDMSNRHRNEGEHPYLRMDGLGPWLPSLPVDDTLLHALAAQGEGTSVEAY